MSITKNVIFDFNNKKFYSIINDIKNNKKNFLGIFSEIKKKKNIYKCYRDPLGIKKIFYGISKSKKKKLIFSNNFLKLVKSCKKNTIKSVKPGTYQEIDGQGNSIKTINFNKEQLPKFQNLSPKIKKRLLEFLKYVKKVSKSNTCIVCLSGGLDSTIIAYYSKRIFKKVITVTAYCAENKKNFEVKAAQKISNYLKLNNIQIPIYKKNIKDNLIKILEACQDWRDYNVHCSALNFIIGKNLASKKLFFPLFTGDFMNEIFADYRTEKFNNKIVYNVPQLDFFYKRRFFISALETSDRETGVFGYHNISAYQPYAVIYDLYNCIPKKIMKKPKSKYIVNGKLIPKKLLNLVLKSKNRAQIGDKSGGLIKYFFDLGLDQKKIEDLFDKKFNLNNKFRKNFISLGRYKN